MKLINWNDAPEGVMTNCGKLIAAHLYNHSAEIYDHTQEFGDRYCVEVFADLRLAPADQQPWLVYELGVTEIPEWAECEYKVTDIAHYKMVGIKEGWTDNPDEVTE